MLPQTSHQLAVLETLYPPRGSVNGAQQGTWPTACLKHEEGNSTNSNPDRQRYGPYLGLIRSAPVRGSGWDNNKLSSGPIRASYQNPQKQPPHTCYQSAGKLRHSGSLDFLFECILSFFLSLFFPQSFSFCPSLSSCLSLVHHSLTVASPLSITPHISIALCCDISFTLSQSFSAFSFALSCFCLLLL